MSIIEGVIYGLIQGLSEFLPVSSSGHLALLPHFLSIEDPGLLFDLSMHVGTALSILIYFRRKVYELFYELIIFIKGKRDKFEAVNMIISTFCSFLMILAIKDLAQAYGRTPFMIAFNLIVFGFIMWVFDRIMPVNVEGKMGKWRPGKAIIIGVAQSLAVFPGVSRSGVTLTAARALGLSRYEGTQYSFLLALPIILGGFVYKLPDFFSESVSFDLTICLMGMFTSFLTGIITIHYFLKFISKMGLAIFFFYRALLALVIYWML